MVTWDQEKKRFPLAGLEQQNGHLTQVEVNKMLGLMSYVAAKVPPNDAVPCRVILLVKLLNIFLNVVLLQGLRGTLHGVLLHVLRHVSIFDHWLSVRHGYAGWLTACAA
uniref:Dynein light chain n=1 Tax=Nothobranchius furzeri TaxID=105023 RepID=A0A8C6MEV1_NOTFU